MNGTPAPVVACKAKLLSMLCFELTQHARWFYAIRLVYVHNFGSQARHEAAALHAKLAGHLSICKMLPRWQQEMLSACNQTIVLTDFCITASLSGVKLAASTHIQVLEVANTYQVTMVGGCVVVTDTITYKPA